MKRTNALFSDFFFPSPEFQVGRVAFDGTNYYIFKFNTISSPKPCQGFFWKAALFVFYSQDPKIALA